MWGKQTRDIEVQIGASHFIVTPRSNVIGALVLADVCHVKNIHLTVFSTGCIYEYESSGEHVIGGKPFTEEDEPNFTGSFYSKTKLSLEKVFKYFVVTI